MSRIGLKPIEIPQGVEAQVKDNLVTIKGAKGNLTKEIPEGITVELDENTMIVKRATEEKRNRSLHGLTRSLLANMVEGVTKGYQKDLELVGVGYRAALQGKNLVLTVGYSHPVTIEPEEGIEFEVPAPTRISVKGFDKQLVGNTAAVIRQVRPPEPYKGKGIKYQGEIIRRKVGKAGK